MTQHRQRCAGECLCSVPLPSAPKRSRRHPTRDEQRDAPSQRSSCSGAPASAGNFQHEPVPTTSLTRRHGAPPPENLPPCSETGTEWAGEGPRRADSRRGDGGLRVRGEGAETYTAPCSPACLRTRTRAGSRVRTRRSPTRLAARTCQGSEGGGHGRWREEESRANIHRLNVLAKGPTIARPLAPRDLGGGV